MIKLMIKDILENLIKMALRNLKIDEIKISKIILEHPEKLSNGDYSTNIAMMLAKQIGQNPQKLAENIVAEIIKKIPKEISKVETAGQGFINFYLSSNFFISQNKKILKENKKFGSSKKLNGKKVIIEYTDPNVFKQFHIGHLMSNAIGESISRIIENNGAKIKRISYGGDIGLHITKTIWGIKKIQCECFKNKGNYIVNFKNEDIKIKIPEKNDTLDYKIFFLGIAYYLGASNYEENIEINTEIQNLNKRIFDILYFKKKLKDKCDEDILSWYKWGREISIKHFEEIYQILDTKFDKMIWESEVAEDSLSIIKEGLEKNIFQKSEGAIIFKGENYGLHTRVFVNSKGIPTYEAKDLGVAKKKEEIFKPDYSIIITANEQNEYFKVMLKVLSFLYPNITEKTKHISHGMLKFSTGKMSSRTGNVITAMSLISEIKEKVAEKIIDKKISEKEKEEINKKVAIGALKYSILKQVAGKDIIFDFDKSISFEGDSGPYLQYSYARARSILRKAKEEKIKKINWKNLKIKQITQLEKMFYRFPEIVERAGVEYSPHYIAVYLIELASAFNNFYAKEKIIDKTNTESSYKIMLTEIFSIILKKGLNLLGIQVLEKM
ncbi:MAG: arginine--tRNA ligase [bacterium]